MKNFAKISFPILIFLCVGLSGLYAQDHDFTDTTFIRESIKYNEYYDFIKFDQNMLEWYKPDAVSLFFEKLGNADKEKVVILHIGDSHLQSDMGSGMSRNMLQGIFGYGGRGMVFPYQAAGTHSTYDYYAKSYGSWDNSKNVAIKPKHNLGVNGITIFTTDSTAGFKIIFRRHYYSIQPNFTKIKLYCHKGPESYDALLTYSSKEKPIKVDCNVEDSLPYIEINLPKASDTLTVMLDKTDSVQKYFECYGLSIESAENNGILYNSVGINGAGFRSFFNQNLMGEQIKNMSPDLIIFDLGINDFFRGSFNYQYIMSSLNKAIDFFRTTVPDAAIMIPNSQDIYFRGRNVKNCEDYSVLSRLVSKEQDVILYDYYNISGGRYSMRNWSKLGLSQRDKTHLSFKGYKLKGELYCNAILNSYYNFLVSTPDSLIAFDNKIDTTDFAKWVVNKSTYYNKQGIASGDKIDDYKNDQVTNYSSNYTGTDPVYYKIRSGDNLGKIAARYGVSVSEIQRWNNMHSTKIYAGKTLLIYPRGYSGSKNTNKTNNSNQNYTTSGNKVYYTIQRGDNLGGIAIKFGVSVKDIKSWNGMSSDKIVAGKKLLIYTNKTGAYVSNNSSNNNHSSGLRRSHIVQKGESLWSIAKKYNTSVDRIKKANGLKSDRINVGDKLIIK